MLSLPVPVLVALALVYAMLRSALRRDGGAPWPPLMAAVVVLAGFQSLLVAAGQYQGWALARWWQPVTAAALPPLVWCAFLAALQRPLRWGDAVHALVPCAVLAQRLFWPDGVGFGVIAAFMGYGTAMLVALHRPGAEPMLTRLGSGPWPAWLWTWVAVGLLVSGLGDALIELDHELQQGQWRPVVISVLSSLTLLALGAVGLSSEFRRSPQAPQPAPADTRSTTPHDTPPDAASAPDDALLQRLDAWMREARPWLDPDLSLLALARKLGVPAKTLSAAVNRRSGENVARYVNRYRIDHACELMRAGQSVTQAMFASGFNTKSNFHREFQRLHGTTPTEWRARAAGPAP